LSFLEFGFRHAASRNGRLDADPWKYNALRWLDAFPTFLAADSKKTLQCVRLILRWEEKRVASDEDCADEIPVSKVRRIVLAHLSVANAEIITVESKWRPPSPCSRCAIFDQDE
jgi:hypothetical protein